MRSSNFLSLSANGALSDFSVVRDKSAAACNDLRFSHRLPTGRVPGNAADNADCQLPIPRTRLRST
jgi:hypothetical protein